MFSPATVNLLIILLILSGVILFLFYILNRRNDIMPKDSKIDKSTFTLDKMLHYVKHTINEITNANLYDLGLSEEEFRRRSNKRDELKKTLKGCTSGDVNDKTYVKEFIFDLLSKTYGLNDININSPLPFEDTEKLTPTDKFDILLHLFKKKYQYQALHELIQKYKLDRPKKVIEDGHTDSYIITKDEIERIYKNELKYPLSFEDKLQILVQRIYQYYKGFGVIDELRDMAIDGVSGGVSGVPSQIETIDDEIHVHQQMTMSNFKGHNSIWIFYKGKSIHLSFLSFGKTLELKRVCQNIYKYNRPGQLSETLGYMVNEMKDGSRVVVVRPPFSESWAFFVRKFDIPNATLHQLIKDENAGLTINVLKFLMKGARITAITGHQGTGKTTLLMAMVKHIYAVHNLRVQEMAAELHLRNIYPERNILSFKETENITGQAGLDIQKKTDGAVNILGEIATDIVAAWMIQMSQVASLFTVFTHHAKTVPDLVYSLRNSTLKAGMFSQEKIAEQQVVNVINFDIHIKREPNGRRYIERITEIIPLDNESDYPTSWKDHGSLDKKMESFMETTTEYYKRMTDRKTFIARNIIEFKDGGYVAVHPISQKNIREILEHLSYEDAQEFTGFLQEQWGDLHDVS